MANLRYKKGLCRFKFFFIKALTFQLQNFSTPNSELFNKIFRLFTILFAFLSVPYFRLSVPNFFASQHQTVSPLSTKIFRLSAPYFFASQHQTFSPLSTILFRLSAPYFFASHQHQTFSPLYTILFTSLYHTFPPLFCHHHSNLQPLSPFQPLQLQSP